MKFKFLRKAIHNLKYSYKWYCKNASPLDDKKYMYFDDLKMTRIPLSSIKIEDNEVTFEEELNTIYTWEEIAQYKIIDMNFYINIYIYNLYYQTTPNEVNYIIRWKLPSVFDKPTDFKLYLDLKDSRRYFAQQHFLDLMIEIAKYKVQYISLFDKFISLFQTM